MVEQSLNLSVLTVSQASTKQEIDPIQPLDMERDGTSYKEDKGGRAKDLSNNQCDHTLNNRVALSD